jgi:integrase
LTGAPVTALTEDACNGGLHDLAGCALSAHPGEYGQVFRAMVLFTGYAGPRLAEGCALEWAWLDFAEDEVNFKVAKFDKPRTVLLLDAAAAPVRSLPRHLGQHNKVFTAKRGGPLSRTAHFAIWNPVRSAFLAKLSEARRREIVDLDWHSLRHFTGHHFYVTLGFSDELAAHQLGHADAKLIRDLYGHGKADALERLKLGARSEVGPIRATSLPHAHGGAA